MIWWDRPPGRGILRQPLFSDGITSDRIPSGSHVLGAEVSSSAQMWLITFLIPRGSPFSVYPIEVVGQTTEYGSIRHLSADDAGFRSEHP